MLHDVEWRALMSVRNDNRRATNAIFSIGHSSLEYNSFRKLLRKQDITAIADVRSMPFSRRNPQYNKDALRAQLKTDGISYVFLGRELGGRPDEARFLCEGVADYESMAKAPLYRKGLDRVLEGSVNYNVALMCSERHPLDCHRCLLVGRSLFEQGQDIRHILHDSTVRGQADIEKTLVDLAGVQSLQTSMFQITEEEISLAYRRQARRVAYSIAPSAEPQPRETAI